MVRPVGVSFDTNRTQVELSDERVIGVPLAWFPRLLRSNRGQLGTYELSPCGIHWEELDENISVAGLLAGRGDQTREGRASRHAEIQETKASSR